jgi:hypothetical protein
MDLSMLNFAVVVVVVALYYVLGLWKFQVRCA